MKKQKKFDEIVTTEEMITAFANSNFGNETRCETLAKGILLHALGYESGNTMFTILLELGLIRRPGDIMTLKSSLTPKGKAYMRDAVDVSTLIQSCGFAVKQ